MVVFWVLPAGGGGRGGSNPLRIFLQIALLAVAGLLAGAITGATAGLAFPQRGRESCSVARR